MNDLRERMAAIKATAATPVRAVKPLITSAPRRGGLVAYTVVGCERMGLEHLTRLRAMFRDCPDMTLNQQVAAIIGSDFNPVPDFEHDRGVAYLVDEYLATHGCKVSRTRGYWTGDGTKEQNYTEVWMPMAGKMIRHDDHNAAVCRAVVAYYAFLVALESEGDRYDGVAVADARGEARDRDVMNSKGY